MKKHSFLKRALIIIMCVVMTVGAGFSVHAAVGPTMYNYLAKYANPQKLKSVEKLETQTVLTANVNGKATKFYIEFPTEGGVRIHTDEEGEFKPESLQKISYYQVGEGVMTLKAGDASVTLTYNTLPWKLEFKNKNGKVVHTITSEQIGFGFNDGEMLKVKISGPVAEDEVLFGLGERFGNYNLVGQYAELWNIDAAYQTENSVSNKKYAYKNVPILHSDSGYSVFFNSLYGGVADIASTKDDTYSLEFNGTDFDFYVYTGTPLENIEDYTDLTGKPATLPKWAYEYWGGGHTYYWNPDYTNDYYGKASSLSVLEKEIAGWKDMGIAPTAVYAENSPSFNKEFYDLAKTANLNVFGWINDQSTFVEHKLMDSTLMKQLLGDVELPATKNYMTGKYSNSRTVDWTHPNALSLLKKVYEEPLSWGLKGLMIDYGEYVPYTNSYSNGMTGAEMHNFNAYHYTKTYNQLFTEAMGKDFVLFARAGCAGSQQWGAVFNGDQGSTFAGLQIAYNGGMSVSASGFSSYGSDIGGVAGGNTNSQLYLRWLQYGAFSPLMRQHGTTERNPWVYGELAKETFKELYWLRMNLLDTIYSANLYAGETGKPMVQTMAVAFPEQTKLSGIDDQYLFANELLVCPILEENVTDRIVNFPSGEKWIDIWTGEVINGGTAKTVLAPINRIPVYIRGGAAMPVQLSEGFALAESMKDKAYDALLVTPVNGNRTTEYKPDDNVTVSSKVTAVASDTFTVESVKSNGQKVVYVAGATAKTVSVDGKEITKLDKLPSDDTAVGYYVDYSKNSTVVFAGKDWKKVSVTDSGLVLKNLAKGAEYESNIFDPEQIEAILDNSADSYWSISTQEDGYALIDLGKAYSADTLIMKWTAYLPVSYTLEVSENKADWTKLLDKQESLGGEESYDLKGESVRYVRIADVIKKGTAPATLYELEVYGDELESAKTSYLPVILQEKEEEKAEENEQPDNESDEIVDPDFEETDQEGEEDEQEEEKAPTVIKKKPVYKTVTVTDWGTVIAIIAGCVVAAAAVAVAVILIVKKRKKQNNVLKEEE